MLAECIVQLMSKRDAAREHEPAVAVETAAALDAAILDAPRLLTEMDVALETGDAAMLFKAAHRLRSSSANLGALQLAALCKTIEALGRQNTVSGASGLVVQAHAVYAEVAQHLKSYRARSAA